MGNANASAAEGNLAMPEQLKEMIKAGKAAGKVIRENWISRSSQEKTIVQDTVTKSNEADLQTETDRRCEELIVTYLKEAFPECVFIGEESTAESESKDYEITEKGTFIIDPIDGTTNFVHTMLSCSVLIGYMEEKEIRQALILDPIQSEMFYAWRGGGAWLQKLDPSFRSIGTPQKLRTSGETELIRAMVATDIGSHRSPEPVERFLRMQKVLLVDNKIRGLRICGGCGLGLANVAAGRMDVYVEEGSPYIWDYAAGSLIVSEAGGFACDPVTGQEIDLKKRNILAASSKVLAESVVTVCKGVLGVPPSE